MKASEPLVAAWQGREVRVRHDDPHLGPYTPRGAVIHCVDGGQGAANLVRRLVAAIILRHEERPAPRRTGQ